MNFFATYLVGRLFFRIKEFIDHWYRGGFRAVMHYVLTFLEAMDETIALRVTLQHFFRPLYGDYTPMGRVLGFVFRAGRILLGIFIYPIVISGAFIIYVTWALIPIYLLSDIFVSW